MTSQTRNDFFIWGINILTVLSFLYISIFAPLNQIFPQEKSSIYFSFTWLVSIIFIIDALISLKILERGQKKVIWLSQEDYSSYLKKYLLFDILAAIPIVIFPDPSLLQLLPLLKVFKVYQKITFFKQSLIKYPIIGIITQLSFWFVLISHWITCGWLVIGGANNFETIRSTYLSSLYWTVTTLTTVGYGDVVPHTNWEKLYAIFVMIIGVGVYGFIIGNVASLLSKKDPAREKHLKNLDDLSALVEYRKIPKDLYSRIRKYFIYMWKQRLGFEETNFLNQLPKGLKLEVLIFLRKDVIKNISLFKDANPRFLQILALHLKPIVLTPNEFLFHEGETGDRVFFVVKGKLKVLRGTDKKEIATISEGDYLGEMALFKNKPRSASVKAITYCDLYYLEKSSFDTLIPKYPEIAKKIEEKVLQREGKSKDKLKMTSVVV